MDQKLGSLMLVVVYFYVAAVCCSFSPPAFASVFANQQKQLMSMASRRVLQTERPYIEDVLDAYAGIPNLTLLALGSSYWDPPENALAAVKEDLVTRSNHRYGNILGHPQLREALTSLSSRQGLDVEGMEVAVTAGANQGFLNLAMLLCDSDDNVIVVAPYYFSHLLSLQLCQARVHICPFDPVTLQPQWTLLSKMTTAFKPKLMVITSPNNPSGYVWPEENIQRIINLCKETSTWLAVDQTYHEFLYDDEKHVYPCGKRFDYEKIVHIFSLSKSFGMAGWRLGYILYPDILSEHMRKIQDTSVTHASIISQKLAYECITSTYDLSADSTDSASSFRNSPKNSWFENHRQTLSQVREALWPIVAPLGTVKSSGAFYFLVPVPEGVTEEEAVDILAKQFGVLLMYGSPFGCPGHLRLSYGSIPPEKVLGAVDALGAGFAFLQQLSLERQNKLV